MRVYELGIFFKSHERRIKRSRLPFEVAGALSGLVQTTGQRTGPAVAKTSVQSDSLRGASTPFFIAGALGSAALA